MSDSYIKKIISVEEWINVANNIGEIHLKDNEEYGHALKLKHDIELITKALSHESLLIWNTHVWAHFNGELWDSLIITIIRKSEKFNKKIMDEYLWVSKNPKIGMKLFNIAMDYAKEQKCEFMFTNVIENHPKSSKVKRLYNKLGFVKDSECFIKKLF